MYLQCNSCTKCQCWGLSLWNGSFGSNRRRLEQLLIQKTAVTSWTILWPMNAKNGLQLVKEIQLRHFGSFWTFSFHYCKCNGYTPTDQKASPTTNWKHARRRLTRQHIAPSCAPGGGLKNSWWGVKHPAALPHQPILSTYQLDILT